MSRALKDLIARAQDVRTATIEVDGIRIRVREPSGVVHAHYAQLWRAGDVEQAIAHLFRHCVITEDGAAALNAEQALALARASAELAMPIVDAIIGLASAQKEPDAPGADGVPDLPAAGAPPV